ncbi:MAG: lysylphosphatidylglycerol synthase domain-containing protein [Cyanobacteriota bacterium]|nr:lysylphosphatidylglycerol synthase domain-containing protein [Cyanobacteriota bacterium]
MKQALSRLKPYLRLVILGATLFFLGGALRQNWEDIATIQLHSREWTYIGLALAVTLIAQSWAGWVWGWILKEFNQPVDMVWATRTFLTTNIAKYLPGNVWHFYQRITAAKESDIAVEAATLSVVMEPLLMAASALAIGLVGVESGTRGIQAFSVVVVAIGIHPQVLNPIAQRLSRAKSKMFSESGEEEYFEISRYPLRPWLGELGFLILRGTGFLLVVSAVGSFEPEEIPLLVGAFSLAWLLGLVVPGAPGGMGVFEASALVMLEQHFSTGTILSSVALYRAISILAESGGAGLAHLDRYVRG